MKIEYLKISTRWFCNSPDYLVLRDLADPWSFNRSHLVIVLRYELCSMIKIN